MARMTSLRLQVGTTSQPETEQELLVLQQVQVYLRPTETLRFLGVEKLILLWESFNARIAIPNTKFIVLIVELV